MDGGEGESGNPLGSLIASLYSLQGGSGSAPRRLNFVVENSFCVPLTGGLTH